jgi:hypothetical protein
MVNNLPLYDDAGGIRTGVSGRPVELHTPIAWEHLPQDLDSARA